MKTLVAAAVALLLFAACTSDEDPEHSTTELEMDECFGANCPGRGAIDVELKVKRCRPGCVIEPLPKDVFLEMVELSGPGDDRCGPGDCGAVPHALRNDGWSVGTWRMIAPKLRGLLTPQPAVIELEEHEIEQVTLIYGEGDY